MATISGDQYAYDREREFLPIARQAGNEAIVRLVEQLILDEKRHIDQLEEVARKHEWE